LCVPMPPPTAPPPPPPPAQVQAVAEEDRINEALGLDSSG